jgi:hypothetical protein
VKVFLDVAPMALLLLTCINLYWDNYRLHKTLRDYDKRFGAVRSYLGIMLHNKSNSPELEKLWGEFTDDGVQH